MRSNTSSRRGFFGKTLALLGAAFACSKAPAAPAAAVPASTPTLPTGNHYTSYQYDEQGDLLSETHTYSYPDSDADRSLDATQQFSYQYDPDGTVTVIRDPL